MAVRTTRGVKTCTECENSVYCETWAQVKCNVRKCYIDDPKRDALRCRNYKKDTRDESAKPKCHCKSCQSRNNEE